MSVGSNATIPAARVRVRWRGVFDARHCCPAPETRRIMSIMAVTIELTDDQMRALSQPHANPPRVVNPHTHEAFVLLRVDQYKKLTEELYDDGPWTREEIQAAAWETAERARWDGEDEDVPEAR